jgi:hypothetical protein
MTMRKLLLAAVYVVSVPSLGAAAPCGTDTLLNYVGLGAGGCEIAGATFFDFGSAASFSGGTEISAADVSVVPVTLATGPRLDFLVTGSAGPSDLLGIVIGYSVAGLSFSGASLEMTGSAAAPDGVVTVVEDLCLGDVFVVDPSGCGGDLRSLIAAHDSLGPTGPYSESFSASLFDVFVDIAIDGGLDGFASLGDTSGPGTVSTAFTAATAVPEPSVISLLAPGVLGLWALRRRRF